MNCEQRYLIWMGGLSIVGSIDLREWRSIEPKQVECHKFNQPCTIYCSEFELCESKAVLRCNDRIINLISDEEYEEFHIALTEQYDRERNGYYKKLRNPPATTKKPWWSFWK